MAFLLFSRKLLNKVLYIILAIQVVPIELNEKKYIIYILYVKCSFG